MQVDYLQPRETGAPQGRAKFSEKCFPFFFSFYITFCLLFLFLTDFYSFQDPFWLHFARFFHLFSSLFSSLDLCIICSGILEHPDLENHGFHAVIIIFPWKLHFSEEFNLFIDFPAKIYFILGPCSPHCPYFFGIEFVMVFGRHFSGFLRIFQQNGGQKRI